MSIVAGIPIVFVLSAFPAHGQLAPVASSIQPSQPSTEATFEPDIEAGLDYLLRRKYEEALKAFRQANARRGEKCAVCWVGMARAYESLGAAKNVVESCDRALPLTGDDQGLFVQAKQLKAIALQDLAQGKDSKRLREAEDELRAALAIDPDAKHLHFYLGLGLLREGRDGDGIAELKEELALRPTGPEADRARSLIENPRRAREPFAPSFSVVTLDREHVDLDSLKDKVVLLDFWGTWCPPCVAAVPLLKDLQKKHADKAFVILSISSDPEEAALRTFIEKHRMVWPQFWDRNHTLQQTFDIKAVPTYVLVDDEGIVRFRTSGSGMKQAAALEDAIKKLLKAAATRRGAVPPGRVGAE